MLVTEYKKIIEGLLALLSIGDQIEVITHHGFHVTFIVYELSKHYIFVKSNGAGAHLCLFRNKIAYAKYESGFRLNSLGGLTYAKWD